MVQGARWLLLGVGVALAACGRPASPPQTEPQARAETPPEPQEGEPSPVDPDDASPEMRVKLDERALQIRLKLDQTQVMVSEPIYAEVAFEGDPGVELGLAWMGRNALGRPENYRVTVYGPRGEALAGPDPGMQMGGQSWNIILGERPGRQRQRLFVPNWVEALSPGRHVIVVETTVQARASKDADWREVEVALRAELEVVADDAAALGELIDAVGEAARGENDDATHEALRKLAAIDDPRTLDHWLEIARLPDYSTRFAAIRALGEIDDDRALAALVRAGQTAAAELPAERYTTEELREQSAGALRHVAANALSTSPHAGALAALLELREDPAPEVRLTVLHRVAKIEGVEALPLLQDFADDPDAMVRGEAERYLRERGD